MLLFLHLNGGYLQLLILFIDDFAQLFIEEGDTALDENG